LSDLRRALWEKGEWRPLGPRGISQEHPRRWTGHGLDPFPRGYEPDPLTPHSSVDPGASRLLIIAAPVGAGVRG
jgi:hypothetical protein